jgi:hypothetical protein
MKKTILLLTALTASIASAATVQVASTIPTGGNIHGAGGAQVALKDSAGTTLAAGMRIRVGFFLNYTSALDTTLRAPGGALPLLAANSVSPNRFIPLGEPPTRPGYGDDTSANNVTKLIAGAVRWAVNYTNVSYVGAENSPGDNNTLADGGLARGTKLFVIAYNTGSLTPDFAAPGFEYGIFSDGGFVVPELGDATLSLNVANVDAAGEVYYGALAASLHTAPVPEPTTGVMSLLAGLGLMMRRRR